jgi:hypothetical protein
MVVHRQPHSDLEPRPGVPNRDLGAKHFDRREQTKTIRRLLRRLTDLGRAVEVRPNAA